MKLICISLFTTELLFTNFQVVLEGPSHYGYTILKSWAAVVTFFDKCILIKDGIV